VLLVKLRLHNTTRCQTGYQTGLTTGWTTGCIVYTNIQPVVNNRFDNWLDVCLHTDAAGCQTVVNGLRVRVGFWVRI